jgi:hypothetical protein
LPRRRSPVRTRCSAPIRPDSAELAGPGFFMGVASPGEVVGSQRSAAGGGQASLSENLHRPRVFAGTTVGASWNTGGTFAGSASRTDPPRRSRPARPARPMPALLDDLAEFVRMFATGARGRQKIPPALARDGCGASHRFKPGAQVTGVRQRLRPTASSVAGSRALVSVGVDRHPARIFSGRLHPRARTSHDSCFARGPGAVLRFELRADVSLWRAAIEEPGWRGFALPRLPERHDPFAGSLLLGLLWGAWHLPLYLVPDWADQNGGATAAGIGVFLACTVAFTVIMT